MLQRRCLVMSKKVTKNDKVVIADSQTIVLTTDIKAIRVVSDVNVTVVAEDTDANGAVLETHSLSGTNVYLDQLLGRKITITGTSVTKLIMLEQR